MEIKPLGARKKKSQAAITDAIILLLITAFSCALIFNFVGTWGNDQDAVLRSAYVLNYMQSVMKTMYYVDASTLTSIKGDGIDVYTKKLTYDRASNTANFMQDDAYNLENSEHGCPSLINYPGTLRVTDLLKRDLGDSDSAGSVYLDDKFGTADVPGRTAMRCAMKELMKPFAFSGYKYYFEVLSLQGGSTGTSVPETPVAYVGPEITNSRDLNVVGSLDTTATPATATTPATPSIRQTKANSAPGCDAAAAAKYQILTVSSPFQVLYSTATTSASGGGGGLTTTFVGYKTRICIWQSHEGV